MSLRWKLILIIILAVVAGILASPKVDNKVLHAIGFKHTNLRIEEGLDLQGGAQLVFQANLNGVSSANKAQALSSLVNVIGRRANFAGTGEVSVQLQNSNQVLVQLPGVTNVNQAINDIGQTAQLVFYEVPPGSQTPVPSGLTGSDLASANPDIDPQTGQPIITFTLKSEAVNKFSELTTRINQENGQLLITLDKQVLFDGSVSSPITNGQGQMQGFSSISVAKNVSSLLNAGALPVPVTLEQQDTVGPSLGAQSVSRSFVAGLIGLAVVALFMISYYRFAGLLAVLALAIYTALTLAIYKLSVFVPGFGIVLTLGGVAGFIISIGMAVDANILIFERLKEEVRAGRVWSQALETSFKRAWTSIRDSNVSTLITCAILFKFGSPIIRSFAVTLGLGVLVSIFTSVVITRNFMRFAGQYKWGRKPSWYGIRMDNPEETKS